MHMRGFRAGTDSVGFAIGLSPPHPPTTSFRRVLADPASTFLRIRVVDPD
jgi:hypothetical protein